MQLANQQETMMSNTDEIVTLFNIESIKALETAAIEQLGLTEEVLMERAGTAAYDVMPLFAAEADSFAIFCGAGNNAGDGYVLARLLSESGKVVIVYYLTEPDKLTGAAKLAAEKCITAGVEMIKADVLEIVCADVIVDAILGTGLTRDVEGYYAEIIECLNYNAELILSLDVPSGLDADTGTERGVCIAADATITFIGAKPGLFTNDGIENSGEVICNALGLPEEFVIDVPESALCVNKDYAEIMLNEPRRANAHKGHFGHVLIIGGNYGMPGATRLAAEAALCVGCGLVTVATRKEHIAAVVSGLPEAMCYGIDSAEELAPLIEKASVIVLGPGLGQDEWAKALWQMAIEADIPKVVDADALNLLADKPMKQGDWVLTPHPGEAAKLLGITSAEIQNDRFLASTALVEKYGGNVVLKGAGSIINCDKPEAPMLCRAGNPGMATGGMGDVLSGVIAGLIAQQYTLDIAAELGVYIHAHAGDCAAKEYGQRGLMASDLFEYIRESVDY